ARLGYGGWADGVDPHAIGCNLRRDRLRQPHDAELRGDICADERPAALARVRGDVDDAPATRRFQVRHRLAHDEERTAQVDVEDPIPFLRGDRLEGPELEDAGAVDDGIEAAEPLPGPRGDHHEG